MRNIRGRQGATAVHACMQRLTAALSLALAVLRWYCRARVCATTLELQAHSWWSGWRKNAAEEGKGGVHACIPRLDPSLVTDLTSKLPAIFD